MEQDQNYLDIVNHILNNEEFGKIKTIEHHGITRYEHSLKVSYYSYLISKSLRLDYEDVARGGLLHDFFLDGDERSARKKFFDTFTHPKRALKTSIDNFNVNEIEKNIANFNIELSKINYLLEENNMKNEIFIKDIPSYIIYYRDGMIEDLTKITEFVLQAGTECAKANPNLKCITPDYCYISYLDGEYKEKDIKISVQRFDACSFNSFSGICHNQIPLWRKCYNFQSGAYGSGFLPLRY